MNTSLILALVAVRPLVIEAATSAELDLARDLYRTGQIAGYAIDNGRALLWAAKDSNILSLPAKTLGTAASVATDCTFVSVK